MVERTSQGIALLIISVAVAMTQVASLYGIGLMGFCCRIGLFGSFLWAIAGSCQSAIILDQVNEVPPLNPEANYYPSVALLGNSTSRAQTFTVGRTGKLAQVDLGLTGFPQSSSYWVDVAIATVINGEPSYDSALASRRILSEDISLSPVYLAPQFSLGVDFSPSDLRITAGETLAIIVTSNLLRSSSPINVFGVWKGASGADSYPEGRSYYYDPNFINTSVMSEDLHFRTFVEVPEPVSARLVLLAVACGLSVNLKRRRRDGMLSASSRVAC